MHILDMLGQYNRNVSNGMEELKAASGMQKVVSTLEELSAGSVFEGTISSVRNGRVTLALSDGQTITARLAGKIPLEQGTPMFFQVKSNDGVTIEIKPYTGAGSAGNPILMNALTEGQVPVTERNLAMVDAMMKEHMPIDKQSVANMVRTVNMNPQVSVTTIVSMTKLGIPVSNEMAAQFESYMTDQHEILQQMDQAIEELLNLTGSDDLDGEQAQKLNQKLLAVFLPEDSGAFNTGGTDSAAGDINATNVWNTNPGATNVSDENVAGTGQNDRKPDDTDSGNAKIRENGNEYRDININTIENGMTEQTLETVLSEKQISTLSRSLQNFPALAENETLFPGVEESEIFVDTLEDDAIAPNILADTKTTEAEGKEVLLDKNMTVRDFLRTITSVLAQPENAGSYHMKKLFGSPEYRTLLKSVMEEQWLMRPEDLKKENKVNELYERLAHQMKQIEDVLQQAGITKTTFHDTAAAVQNNIEFMNQLNQAYTYIQIPLKMSGQNANGELYVYTNKKNLRDPDAELSAFLHLDLEHLGSTDVSVKMLHKNVKTNFYLSDDASYQLVGQYIPVLEERLKKKGYQCTITLTREEKKINFGEDFLRKDMPAAGTLHRYSFDVRA